MKKWRVTHQTLRGYAIIKVRGEEILGVLAVGEAFLTTMPKQYMTFTAYPRLYNWSATEAYLKQAGYHIAEELEETPATPAPKNEKVALWCRLYEHFKGIKYRVSVKEIGMLGNLPITEELLTYYLDDTKLPDNPTTWLFKGKQSIGNLAGRFNEVRAAMTTPQAPAKGRHPNHWDRGYAQKLDGPGLSEYYKHLRELGLVAKRDRLSNIIDWVPKEQAQHGA